MPPVSVCPLRGFAVSSIDVSRLSRLISSRFSLLSFDEVFILLRFTHLSIVPKFSPAIPPVYFCELITLSLTQFPIRPVDSFIPAMPPSMLLPSRLPSNVQFSIFPLFTPAMPPKVSLPSPSLIYPLTVRFFTAAPSCIYRKSP